MNLFLKARVVGLVLRSSFFVFLVFAIGCAISKTRPVQEMANADAAIRAAKEVKADSLAPELFRLSKEWYFKAQQEYKMKNFKEAHEYSEKSRHYAEQAEYEAIRNGGNRIAVPPDPLSEGPGA